MLDHLQTQGATVRLKTGKWIRAQMISALKRVSHQSSCQHTDVLCKEFVDMI
jgi:hypothetical protein